MAAALELFKQTGDRKYVFKLLREGLWSDGMPPGNPQLFSITKG